MNNVSILGRLTKDIDLRYSQEGMAVGNFTLAVNRPFKNQNGEYEADFIRCIAFGKTAEVLSQYVKKGNQLAIEGRIQTGRYEKEGQTVYTTDVVVNQFTFVESARQQPTKQQVHDKFMPPKDAKPIDVDDDNLPF